MFFININDIQPVDENAKDTVKSVARFVGLAIVGILALPITILVLLILSGNPPPETKYRIKQLSKEAMKSEKFMVLEESEEKEIEKEIKEASSILKKNLDKYVKEDKDLQEVNLHYKYKYNAGYFIIQSKTKNDRTLVGAYSALGGVVEYDDPYETATEDIPGRCQKLDTKAYETIKTVIKETNEAMASKDFKYTIMCDKFNQAKLANYKGAENNQYRQCAVFCGFKLKRKVLSK